MDLQTCRQQLDAIDTEMKLLFLKRMQIVSEVAQYKKEKAMPIFDATREANMKQRLSADLNEGDKENYLAFLNALLEISRKHQERLLCD